MDTFNNYNNLHTSTNLDWVVSDWTEICSKIDQRKNLYLCINAQMYTYRDRVHLTFKTAQLFQTYANTHISSPHPTTMKSIPVLLNVYPCSSIIIWQSATTLKSLCFRAFNLRTTMFQRVLTAFHWKKGPLTTKTFRWKKGCGNRRIRTCEWPLLMR